MEQSYHDTLRHNLLLAGIVEFPIRFIHGYASFGETLVATRFFQFAMALDKASPLILFITGFMMSRWSYSGYNVTLSGAFTEAVSG